METVTTSIVDLVTTAGTAISSAFTCIWDLAISNPLIATFCGAGVILAAIGVFGAVKSAV